MRVCIQVTVDGAIVSEYFSSWDDVAHDRLAEYVEAWAATDESTLKCNHEHGEYSALRVNINDVTTGHALYDEGISEF